jgi:ABC-type nitrate/sulfonate/bicarbonate transport system substrate-binding protein
MGSPIAAVADSPKADLGTVSIGWVKATANLLAFVAPEIAPKYGLTINSVNFNNSNDCQTAMISGQIDLCILTPIHLMRAIDTGVDLVQIAGEARRNSDVVISKNLGVAKDDWAALKAALKKKKLRVAVSPGSITELLSIAEFAKNGIDVDKEMEVVNIPNFGQHPQALRSGEFDMLFTLDPLATMTADEGIGTIFNYPYDTSAGDLNTTWVVTRAWLNKNPKQARAFIQTLIAAAKELNSDKALLLEKAEQLTGLKAEILVPSFANNRFDLRNGLPQMQALALFAFERKYTSRNVAAELPKAVDDSFLREFGADK